MKRDGFTLIEVVIVMSVIIILAVVAIPKFLRARYNANESSAIATMKLYVTELESYRSNQNPPAYPSDLATLASETPAYLDGLLGQDPATKQGYTFTYAQVSENEYALTAEPADDGVTGTRVFYVDETGIIRADDENGEPVQ